jgi:hypothetical protein
MERACYFACCFESHCPSWALGGGPNRTAEASLPSASVHPKLPQAREDLIQPTLSVLRSDPMSDGNAGHPKMKASLLS